MRVNYRFQQLSGPPLEQVVSEFLKFELSAANQAVANCGPSP